MIFKTKISVGFFGFEFPRYNYAFNGLKYRYLYGTGFGEVLPDRIIKIDTQTKVSTCSVHRTHPSNADNHLAHHKRYLGNEILVRGRNVPI